MFDLFPNIQKIILFDCLSRKCKDDVVEKDDDSLISRIDAAISEATPDQYNYLCDVFLGKILERYNSKQGYIIMFDANDNPVPRSSLKLKTESGPMYKESFVNHPIPFKGKVIGAVGFTPSEDYTKMDTKLLKKLGQFMASIR